MPRFRLRIPDAELRQWAERYAYPGEEQITDRLAPTVRDRGYLVRDEFLELCRWKTPRSQPRCARNSEEYVREVTRIALATTNEELKIRALLLLTGVGWPTASVIVSNVRLIVLRSVSTSRSSNQYTPIRATAPAAT